MFVVVEWNQASGQPRMYDGEVHVHAAFALDVADHAFRQNRAMGRRERYTVHALDDDPEWDSTSV